MNLGEKIIKKEIRRGNRIAKNLIKKELKKNPKFIESDIMKYLSGIIGARALIMLVANMANYKKRRA